MSDSWNASQMQKHKEYSMSEKKQDSFFKTFTVNGKTVEQLVKLIVIMEYDERGNTIYHRTRDEEIRYEYETEKMNTPPGGHCVHEKSSDGSETWYVYDAAGHCVYEKNSFGAEEWLEYNEKGKLIHKKQTHRSEYDENDNLIYTKLPCALEYWWEYDEAGHEIHSYNSEGTFEERREYDEKGREIHRKTEDEESWYKYDEEDEKGRISQEKHFNGSTFWQRDYKHGDIIYEKNSDGSEIWYEYDYDENGNKIHCKDSNGFEKWYKCDEKGNMTYVKYSNGKHEEWHEYNEKGEETLFRMFHYGEYSEWVTDFDERGNITHSKMSSTGGDEEFYDEDWTAYDEAGREIYRRDRFLSKDEEGQKIYKDKEHWTEYEFFENGKLKKELIYEAVKAPQNQKDI